MNEDSKKQKMEVGGEIIFGKYYLIGLVLLRIYCRPSPLSSNKDEEVTPEVSFLIYDFML